MSSLLRELHRLKKRTTVSSLCEEPFALVNLLILLSSVPLLPDLTSSLLPLFQAVPFFSDQRAVLPLRDSRK